MDLLTKSYGTLWHTETGDGIDDLSTYLDQLPPGTTLRIELGDTFETETSVSKKTEAADNLTSTRRPGKVTRKASLASRLKSLRKRPWRARPR